MIPALLIDYTNYRGERKVRRIMPLRYVFRVSEYHPGGPTWLLIAHDLDRGECTSETIREFKASDIHKQEVEEWPSP